MREMKCNQRLKIELQGEEKMFRSVDLSRAEFIDEDKRTVRIALTSEAPVRRPFGWEILDHSQESINTDFISQGRAAFAFGSRYEPTNWGY